MSKDIVIIGGGPGGYAAGIYCAHMGQSVTIIEKAFIGGTCLNVGCVPTKAFVQASHVFSQAKTANTYGINIDGEVNIDFKKTSKFKKNVVSKLRNGVGFLVKKSGIKLIQGTGKMIDKNTVEVVNNNGEKSIIHADSIILATGSREIELPGFETDGVRILNSTQMLDITSLPESVAIIGGGVIGAEFASIFSDFGKDVTIVEMCENIIPTEDRQISQTLKEKFESKGIKVLTEAKASKIIDKNDTNLTFEVALKNGSISNITVDQILVCIGRKANLENIGLEETGVIYNKKYIETNDFMQTNIPNIYAVGDITKSPQLAHVAYHEALVASKNIAGTEAKADYHAVPGCIFSNPEVARVGLTEAQAKKEVANVKIKVESFSGNAKAMIEHEADGYIKMIYDGDTGRVLGCSIIGPKATELIAEPSLAVNLNLTVEKLAENINAHPSLSEIIGETAAAAIGLNLHSV